MKLALLTGILISSIWVLSVRAAEPEQTHALMTPEEQALYQKSKKRLYPGGKDEDSLKVQPQLAPVTRKMGPTQDAPLEEEHQDATD
jgi:hypothetical protein